MTVDPGQMVPQHSPPVSVVAPPPATGIGSRVPFQAWCEAHSMVSAGCPYCADPVLEAEMLAAAQRLLDELGGPE